jgi:ribosomal protein S18 acetylase RimI-like enzyme
LSLRELTTGHASANSAKPEESGVIVRRMRQNELEETARACFPDDDFDTILERLKGELQAQQAGRGWTLVAELAEAVIGTLRIERHRAVAWIHNVAVRKDLRGRGIVQRLFAAAETECRQAGVRRMALHVRRDNASAIRAYEKAGFRFTFVDGMRGDQLRYERDLPSGKRALGGQVA